MNDVVFYVNGPARLLMSCVIAEERFPGARVHLVLLDQFGYDYERLLPHVRGNFASVRRLRVRARSYSHLDQALNAYLNRYPELRGLFDTAGTLVLFGLRSPVQKYLIRQAKRRGMTVEIFAESIATDRYFVPGPPDGPLKGPLRHTLARAFAYQHDYDRFHMLNPDIYADSPHRPKLVQMFDLYGSDSFRRHAGLMTRDLALDDLTGYDTVFLGQPLSDFDDFVEPEEEEQMLREILGDRRVLVLPHPNERLEDGRGKYRVLPNARVCRPGIPSELLLLAIRPERTITYSSTAGVNYAMMNRASENSFYPIFRARLDMLLRYRQSLPNLTVSARYATQEDPGALMARRRSPFRFRFRFGFRMGMPYCPPCWPVSWVLALCSA